MSPQIHMWKCNPQCDRGFWRRRIEAGGGSPLEGAPEKQRPEPSSACTQRAAGRRWPGRRVSPQPSLLVGLPASRPESAAPGVSRRSARGPWLQRQPERALPAAPSYLLTPRWPAGWGWEGWGGVLCPEPLCWAASQRVGGSVPPPFPSCPLTTRVRAAGPRRSDFFPS